VLCADPTILLVGAVVTDFLPIPHRARAGTLLSTDATAAANVTLEFYRDDAALAPMIYAYRGPDPTKKIDVVGGARFYKVRSLGPATLTVLPDWELAL